MAMNRMLLLAGSICAIFSLHVVVEWLPLLRFFVYTFWAGAFAVILSYVALIVSAIRRSPPDETDALQNLRPLAFTSPGRWDREVRVLSEEHAYRKKPLYPPSFLISESLDTFLESIISNFVNSWYSHISSDPSFTIQVEKTIHNVLEVLRDRLLEIDIVEVLVGKIVPLITSHLADVSKAERSVRGKHLNNNLTESEELDLAIAGKYKDGNLHPAASLSFPDMKLAQQSHLRQLVDHIIRSLLPENELKSRGVAILVREILACAVLYPVLGMLADPDTWNQLIEAAGKSALQDRKSVKKLRAALDEHATPKSRQDRLRSTGSSGKGRGTGFVKLHPLDDERTFERFIRSIRLCNNLSDARRMRNDISSQLKRDSRLKEPDHVYIRRLETGKRLLDQRVAYLAAGTGGAPPPSRQPVDNGHRRRLSIQIESARLVDILRDSSGLSYFMEHMDRQNRLPLVQFWLVVDGLRNPLEDDLDEDEEEPTTASPWTESDRNDLAQVYEAYFSMQELMIPDKAKKDVKSFLRCGSRATTSQYHKARGAVLRAQTAVLEIMEHNDLVSFKNSDLFYKYLASDDLAASSTLPLTSTSMARTASWIDSPTNSEPAEPHLNSRPSGDGRPSDANRDGWDDGPMSLSVQSIGQTPQSNSGPGLAIGRRGTPENGVVEAMEAVLSNILDERPTAEEGRSSLFPPSPGILSPNSNSPRSSIDVPAAGRTANTKIIKDNGKTAESEDFSTIKSGLKDKTKEQSLNIASLGLVNPYSRGEVFSSDNLFPEEDNLPEYEIDEDMFDLKNKDDDEDEIHQAAPGDLGLAEAIAVLSFDIEKLSTQELVIDSLTRKAELTNNMPELRILRKSKASLQREIRRKELQRQQYIVQESDNSLFGRSSIRIKSSIVGKEGGKEYALYVIEVHRNGGEHMPAAQWAVARRYSEFFQLHQNLRTRFPQVRDLEFPRRRVVLHLQKDFLEKRRIALEKYLKSLLIIPDVCRSRDFRGFLSVKNINPHLTPSTETSLNGDKSDLITRLYNSISDGMEDVLGNLPMLDQISTAVSVAASQVASTTSYPVGGFQPFLAGGASNNTLSDVAEAEAELSAFEDKEAEPFVKSICDLFLETFELNKGSGSNWLRGRAVVVVLHQLLGGTIEKKVREQIKQLTQEDSILRYIQTVKDSLFPQNPSPSLSSKPPRSPQEKLKSNNEARIILNTLLPDVAASVVGRANAAAAAKRLFAAFNNQRLNTSIVYTLFDEIISTLFDQFVDSVASK